MSVYLDLIAQTRQTIGAKQEWSAINAEYAVRMQLQNRFKTGLEIAQYTADIMRRDMANYDADSSKYTQSLGCWHGFVAQQVMMSVKKHQQTTDRSYIYLSGWMVAALRVVGLKGLTPKRIPFSEGSRGCEVTCSYRTHAASPCIHTIYVAKIGQKLSYTSSEKHINAVFTP